ncbi:DUF1127 domain-containing protein [Palleronia sp.]|uniref:DUF1127 domain-containing protein n=1 Tax=Palleronia sp. TaxID=1940284 RepID=UPI0035C7A850
MTALSTRAIRARRLGILRRTSLLEWWGLYRQRRQLGELDARMLSDIGCSRIEAEAEAGRPVWDAPAHWRK